MTPERTARGIFVATVVFVIASAAMGVTAGFPSASDAALAAGVTAIAIVYVGAGALLVARVPRNPIGWIVICVGFFQAMNALTSGYAELALDRSGPPLPLGEIAMWASMWTWIPSVAVLATFLLLLFPDGHPPTPRWRVVGWVAGIGITLTLTGTMIGSWPIRHVAFDHPSASPTGMGSTIELGALVAAGAACASIASLIVRYRRAQGDERLQLRWFILAAIVVIVGVLLGVAFDTNLVLVIGFFLIPITATVAILKYRLYEIDVVISKTIVYGALAALITIVYVAVVVGIGSFIHADLALSVAATGLVAVAFQSARERLQRWANRLVYGERASPYEVLAGFSERIADTYATEDVLPRTARVIAEGTGAERADVWLRIGDQVRRAASWPDNDDEGPATLALIEGDLPVFDDTDHSVPVTYRDELLGCITVTKRRGDPLTPTESALLDDLAQQAGLVLSNVRLTAELEARLQRITEQTAELQASRQRIVAAQDAERRRLERNIHDGAQQHLVALAVKLRLARGLLAKDPARARTMLAELRGEVDEALDTLYSLALGIYPPLLEEQGIAPALAAQYTRTELPVHLETDGTGRYPIDTEAAVYFCVLEALQNAAKYARATTIDVRLTESANVLRFEVSDDGVGFEMNGGSVGTGLAGMRDRLAVLGGDAEVWSEPGRGTRVSGRVPVADREGAPA